MAAVDTHRSARDAGSMEPVHLAPGEGPTIVNPLRASLTFKLRGAQTAGRSRDISPPRTRIRPDRCRAAARRIGPALRLGSKRQEETWNCSTICTT